MTNISSEAWYYEICNCFNSIRMKLLIYWNQRKLVKIKRLPSELESMQIWLYSIIHAIQQLWGKYDTKIPSFIFSLNPKNLFKFLLLPRSLFFVFRYFKNTAVHVHAIRGVKPDERLSENYGPLYSKNAKEERRRKLKKFYWFDCSCEACEQNWPVFSDMNTTEIRLK